MRWIWIPLALVCLTGVVFLALEADLTERPTSDQAQSRLDGPPSPSPDLTPTSRFLIATRQVKGLFFEKSVVLLIQHNQNGAMGLILNRPSKTPVADLLFEQENPGEEPDDEAKTLPTDTLYVGGPVDPSQVVFLVREPETPPRSIQVLPDVYASSESEVLDRFAENIIPPEHFRAYVGYAGWGPGQLEGEIKRGDWFQSPAQSKAIFDPNPEHIWERLVAEHEGVQVRRMKTSTRKVANFLPLFGHDS